MERKIPLFGFSDFFSVVQKVVGYYSWALSVKKNLNCVYGMSLCYVYSIGCFEMNK